MQLPSSPLAGKTPIGRPMNYPNEAQSGKGGKRAKCDAGRLANENENETGKGYKAAARVPPRVWCFRQSLLRVHVDSFSDSQPLKAGYSGSQSLFSSG